MALRKRIGVMVPATNTTAEPDFYRTIPDNVTVHFHRMWITDESGTVPDGLERMDLDIEPSAQFLATANVDVIAYACTAGSFFKGLEFNRRLLQRINKAAGVPAVSASSAAVEAFRALGVKKFSVVSPDPDWSNERSQAFFEEAGFEVLNIEGEPEASSGGTQEINDKDPSSIVDFSTQVCKPEADALFVSCTAWRSLEVVDELEERLGKPVVTSNQATIWHTLATLGVPPRPGVGGRLFQTVPR